MSRIKW